MRKGEGVRAGNENENEKEQKQKNKKGDKKDEEKTVMSSCFNISKCHCILCSWSKYKHSCRFSSSVTALHCSGEANGKATAATAKEF